MNRRGAVITALLIGAGSLMKAQEQERSLMTGRAWNPAPGKLRFTIGGESGFTALEVRGPKGETVTLTPEQIMEALREPTEREKREAALR